ncbi:MAG: hypothetical protein ACT4P7_09975 [Gemmatimonadaceae bacterium]
MSPRSNPPLHVVGFHATRRGEAERGPQVRVSGEEARARLLSDGELAWVEGPRRSELATVIIDDAVPRGGAVLRDISGVSVSEVIRLQKPDYDTTDKYA